MLETVNPRKLRIPHIYIYICPSHRNKLIIPTSMQVIQYICVHGAVPRRPEITSQTQSLKTKGKKKRWGAVVEETYIYIHSMELEKANDKPNQRLLQHNITTAITRRTHRGMFTPLLRWRWRGGRRPCCGFLKYHIRAKITRR